MRPQPSGVARFLVAALLAIGMAPAGCEGKNDNGACTASCKGTTPACCPDDGDLVCKDLSSDSSNCGACGTVCAGEDEAACCNGSCLDPLDPKTCGGCGKTYSMATGREVRIGYKRDDVNRGYTIEKNRAEQNGVKRPSAGTLCGQVWAALDAVHATHMPVAADLDTIATVNNWNRNNVSCEFYQWRKFMGIKGRQVRAK